MYFYLAPYVFTASTIKGDGLVWRPVGALQPGAGWIDLSPPIGLPTHALLAVPSADPDPQLKPIGADALDSLGVAVKISLSNALNLSKPIDSATVKDVCGELAKNPPVNGWNLFRPLPSGLSELWIAGQQVWHDAPAKGSGVMAGLSIGTEDVILHRADFTTKRRFRESVVDLLGYLPLVALAILLLPHPSLALGIGMALPKTDTFTGTDATLLTVYDTSWIAAHANGQIQANEATGYYTGLGDGNPDVIVRWTGDTFNDNQYSEGTVGAVVSGNYFGCSIRGAGIDAASTSKGYYCYQSAASANGGFRKYAGSYVRTDIQVNPTGTWTTGDVCRVQGDSSTIRWMKNGADYGASPYSDSSLTSGDAGLGGFGATAGYSSINTLVMGNLGRTTKNSRAAYLGMEVGMGLRMPL